MNESLSIMELVMQAGFVVKGVMILLLVLSLLSWIAIIERLIYFASAKRCLQRFEATFWSGVSLFSLYTDMNKQQLKGIETVFFTGLKEYTRLKKQHNYQGDIIMVGVQRAIRTAISKEEELLDKHLAFLASVGSVSPYIGLFGTVWGIMNSFRGLANVHQASIATVAPGISEALIATAIGLFAAIPAVVSYNRFVARSDALLSGYRIFAEEFSNILHRQAYLKSQGSA